jgi:hypothetical protein
MKINCIRNDKMVLTKRKSILYLQCNLLTNIVQLQHRQQYQQVTIMKLSRKELKKLRESINSTGIADIQTRLKNAGFDFSLTYIWQVLNPDNPRYNDLIIREAIAYAEDAQTEFLKLKSRIDALQKNKSNGNQQHTSGDTQQ